MNLIRRHPWWLLGVLLVCLIFAYHDVASSPVTESSLPSPEYHVMDIPPVLSAKAFGVFDLLSGEMLVSHNETDVLPIASVTKLATASVLVANYDLEQKVYIEESDLLGEGRAGSLEVGEEYTYRDLLFPLLLESSNDAAEAYERTTEGVLVKKMNQLAEELQLVSTNFVDTSGLADTNQSSVLDLASLLRHIHQETPLVLDISQLRNYVTINKTWTNNSPVREDDYRGGKHGYTEAANRTAVALFAEDFSVGERQLIYVILGSNNLTADTEILRNFVAKSVTYQ